MTKKVPVVAIVAVAGVILQAADFNKALVDTEGRRRAAENGLRAIKTKSPALGDQVRIAYTKAATEQNAWLEMVCQGVEQSSSSEANMTVAAEAAATSLVAWVAARNRALGETELAGASADTAKTWVHGNLTEIAAEVWRRNRTASQQQRERASADLKKRLLWKSWEQIP
jgi:hypothetical protein